MHEIYMLIKLKQKPKLVLTGSALGYSIDKKLIKFAKKNKILSVSIIEHWTNFIDRFKIGNKLYFPDLIFVNDKFSFNQALREGKPKKKLKIMGNVYFEKLSKKKFFKSSSKKIKKIKTKSSKIIMFISENIKGQKKIQNEYSSNEFETIKKIKKILNKEDTLIIKCHPEEKLKKFNKIKSKNILIIKKMSFQDMIFSPNYIIGMKSILLLELGIFRNDIISFRPKKDKAFIGEKLKITKLIRSLSGLSGNLIKNDNKFFKNYFNGSSKKIDSFIKDYI